VDRGTVEALCRDHPALFQEIEVKYEENEHSLEMHISLLKYVFGEKEFTLVPLMVGHVEENLDKYGQALLPLWLDQ